jgi:hypothetical protein
MSMSLLCLGVVTQAGDLNARVKGINNCTKAQVAAQLPERVSSTGPLQYQECGLVCEAVEESAFTYPIRFPTFVNSLPSAPIW